MRGRARRERWPQAYPAVHYLPGSVDSWDRANAGRLELYARDAALGLRSAAYVRSMIARAPVLTKAVRPHGLHRPHRHLIDVHLTRGWDERNLDLVEGLVVTSPGATLRHLAEVLDVEPLRAVAIDGLRAGGIEMEGEFPWRCPDGRVIHFEGALPASWVALERDGRGKYATGTSLITDRRRWTQASGRWRQV